MHVYFRFPSSLALILALLAFVLGGAAAQSISYKPEPTALYALYPEDQTRSTAQSSSYKPEPTPEQLLELRQLLISAGYEDVNKAMAAGYEQFGGCMSGPQGSQGIHFTNGTLIGNPSVNALQPEILMYEPRADGSMKLIGVEYLVFQQAWHDAGNEAVPVLFGQEFGLNTTLLDEPFYLLHVWLFQYNPKGLFSNWNPLVVCPKTGAHAIDGHQHAPHDADHDGGGGFQTSPYLPYLW